MSFEHVSVMLGETVDLLNVRPGGVYLDGTLGGGGHTAEILRRLGGTGHVYGVDRDEDALAACRARFAGQENFTAVHGNFHDAPALLGELGVRALDGALLDLGVSSHQLDTAERGFSYHADAPLDMRMDRTQELTAREIVNNWPEREIARILLDYGEERWAARVAAVIAERRERAPLETTADLVACVDAAIPKRVRMKETGHSARRTFQALRIAVNDELDPLRKALEDIVALLVPGGRLAVLTFHSLEDRIVKRAFRTMQDPCICPPKAPVCVCGRKPVARVLCGGGVRPGPEELERNPRARSATLRGCEKLAPSGARISD